MKNEVTENRIARLIERFVFCSSYQSVGEGVVGNRCREYDEILILVPSFYEYVFRPNAESTNRYIHLSFLIEFLIAGKESLISKIDMIFPLLSILVENRRKKAGKMRPRNR